MSISFAEIAATRKPPQSIDFDDNSFSSSGDGLPTSAMALTVAEMTTLAGCGTVGSPEAVEQQSVSQQQPPTESIGKPQVHVVQAGEHLCRIAEKYETTVEAFMAANPDIKSADLIYAGQRLNVPGGGSESSGETARQLIPSQGQSNIQPETQGGSRVHVVQAGENLFRIAIKYDTTVAAIAAANGIPNPNRINVGQTLTIPGPGGGGSAPAGQEPAKIAQNPPAEPQQNQPVAPPPLESAPLTGQELVPQQPPAMIRETEPQASSDRILTSAGEFNSWASGLSAFLSNPSLGIKAELPLERDTDTSQVSFSVETVFGRDVLAVRGLPAGARLLADMRNVAFNVPGIQPGYAGSFLPEYGSFQAFLIYNPETGIYYAITAESLNKADLSIGGGYVNPGGALKSPAQVVIFGFKNPPNDSSEVITDYYSVR